MEPPLDDAPAPLAPDAPSLRPTPVVGDGAGVFGPSLRARASSTERPMFWIRLRSCWGLRELRFECMVFSVCSARLRETPSLLACRGFADARFFAPIPSYAPLRPCCMSCRFAGTRHVASGYP